MEKILTIVVPSYNAANYLPETIPTMLAISNIGSLEIIIVNDGSQDNTLDIANQFKQQYPDNIVVIDKENGGHGSTINAGIKLAKGKYFKVVDADDWVDSNNLSSLIEYLRTVNHDQVISPYVKRYENTNKSILEEYTVNKTNQEYLYSDFLSEINTIPLMHSIVIKTEILRNNDIFIDENCFYVDLEYNVYPMPFIKTISYFNKPIYQYRLGTQTQSVNMQSYIKNIAMHRLVILQLIKFYNNYVQISGIKKKLLENLIKKIIAIHTNICLSISDSSLGKKEFITLREEILKTNVFFYKNTIGKKLFILKHTNDYMFHLLSYIYRKLSK